MNLDDALRTFIAEARELLGDMEDALLHIEQTRDDPETINAIFRAAHTIKGSAGLFGLDHVVAFTHVAESVLDLVRNDRLQMDAALVAVFLGVCDHLRALVDNIADGSEPDDGFHDVGNELVNKLQARLGHPSLPATAANVPAATPNDGAAGNEGGVDTDNWHLSLRFGADVLKNGMDPLAFFRYLTTFGQIVHIVTLTDAVPPLSELDPETCHLGFELALRTDAEKATIADAFEFVRDDAQISILPPHSNIDDYRRLIAGLPEEDMLLGDILVRCGTLTRAELDVIVAEQACQPQTLPIGEVLAEQRLARQEVVAVAKEPQKRVKEHKGGESGLIRVNAEKLDEHINLIGELIIASAGAGLIAQHAGLPDLLETVARLSRLVEEVRDSALTLRMVQIGATFRRFERVVHDVCADLGKDIRLEISGAETELDKTVVEKIGDPLTHLVRNSMDHGIEASDVRLARGKPAHGTVRLNAYHDSGSIVIEVSDDGGGLDRSRILTKAIERGLIKADQQIADHEICKLIFEPGFSTADQVSNLSGSGVGMDVVRRNITALRGTIDIDSTEGRGTTMRIRLPLTLAIIDGFLVGVAASTFVVPLDMVVECVELTPAEIADAQGRDHLNLRGEVLPFIRLEQLFDIREARPSCQADDETDAEQRFGLPGGVTRSATTLLTAEGAAALANDPELVFLLNPVKRQNVVVVQYAGHRAGLVVDSLMGEYQTVIRPLGAVFSGIDGISGFTILGSGNVALILDVPGLVKRVALSDQGRYMPPSVAERLAAA